MDWGEREESIPALSSFDSLDHGWFTVGAESLALFLRARDSAATAQLNLLAASPSEGLIKHPASVGALVGKLALLRMRAHASLGHVEEALFEAHAVVAVHGYRDYDLHLQARDAEFDVRLVDRLAVTPDELLEARNFLHESTVRPGPQWLLHEGRLIRSA